MAKLEDSYTFGDYKLTVKRGGATRYLSFQPDRHHCPYNAKGFFHYLGTTQRAVTEQLSPEAKADLCEGIMPEFTKKKYLKEYIDIIEREYWSSRDTR